MRLEETLGALDAINTMDTDALCSFVAQNFKSRNWTAGNR